MHDIRAQSQPDLKSARHSGVRPPRPFLNLVLSKPVETVGTAAILAAAVAIVVNALFLQNTLHPAPLLARASAQDGLPRRAGQPLLEPVARPALPTMPHSIAAQQPVTQPALPTPRTSDADQDRVKMLRALQAELAAGGFYEGAADGLTGPKTDSAIRAFQAKAGMPVDGQPSEALLLKVRAASASRRDPIAAMLAGQSSAPGLPSAR